jgi:hypothetical protein
MRTELNASIRDIPMPSRMARRPVSSKGFPVPYFVTARNRETGEWDFRFVNPRTTMQCHTKRLCWLCGEPIERFRPFAFVIGPMCSINRVSSEPPSHVDCAAYAVRACPFLARPSMRRNDADLSESQKGLQIIDAPGIAISHNPGVTLIWTTKQYRVEPEGGGFLFFLGEPINLQWFKEGRTATRAEIDAAIEKGLPYLRAAAAAENALPDLERQIARAQPLLPAA